MATARFLVCDRYVLSSRVHAACAGRPRTPHSCLMPISRDRFITRWTTRAMHAIGKLSGSAVALEQVRPLDAVYETPTIAARATGGDTRWSLGCISFADSDGRLERFLGMSFPRETVECLDRHHPDDHARAMSSRETCVMAREASTTSASRWWNSGRNRSHSGRRMSSGAWGELRAAGLPRRKCSPPGRVRSGVAFASRTYLGVLERSVGAHISQSTTSARSTPRSRTRAVCRPKR